VNGVSIMLLVEYNIENRTSQVLAAELPKLNPDALKQLRPRLNALPAGGSLAQTLPIEAKTFEITFLRTVKDAKDKEALLTLLRPVLALAPEGPGRGSRKQAVAFLEGCGSSGEGVRKKVAEMKESYARMALSMNTLEECIEAWDRETTLLTNNPVFKEFGSSLPFMRWKQTEAEVRRALLLAAIAVQLDGRESLKSVPDPVIGGPFEYSAFEGGFELRSKLALSEPMRSRLKLPESPKPLTLTVGERRK
jgi:hypothetical protein